MWPRRIEAEAADADPIEQAYAIEELAVPERRWPLLLLGGAMILLALGWIGAVIAAIVLTAPAEALTPLRLAAWAGVASGPLTLLAVLALFAFRTGAVEANAFSRRARLLRRESARLTDLLALIDDRVEAARTSLAGHGEALSGLGDATTVRLGASAEALRGEAERFAGVAATLDDATAMARSDLGVLLADLPDAEARARSLGDQLRTFGMSAEEHAAILGERIALIEAQARVSDQSSAAAARRLATELERIENAAVAADRTLGEVASRLGGASDAALAEAAIGLDGIRRGLAEQSAALGAMIAQARAGFGQAGDEATRSISRQLDMLDQRIEQATSVLREQEAGARGMLDQIELAIATMEQRFAMLGDRGASHTATLTEAIVTIGHHAEQVGRSLGQGAEAADILVGRAESLRAALAAGSSELVETMPSALARLRLQSDQGLAAISDASRTAARLIEEAGRINERLGEGAALIELQQTGMERLTGQGAQLLTALGGELAALESAAARVEVEMRAIGEGATPALAEALGRMRDAATEAAREARAALSGVIPEVADALGQAAAREVEAALAGVGRNEIAQIGLASAQAADAARGATEQLTRQLLIVAETTRTLEARIADHATAAEAADEASFARQAGLLIEALNSTAIDVAKLFSNEPADSAWAAYLKGDRGVFTRRAVRLLDTAEAKAISQRYGDDPEFHEQVDRYIHDFEALLRRVLSVRAGEPMSIALLSSDIGKLYVALAQAIERLRR